MMSQAYTHHWDEIEYFELAVPHAEKDAEGRRRQGRLQRLPRADRLPRRRRAAARCRRRSSRANESVSCDLCHTVTGFEGDTPFNFNWISEPGKIKQGPREGVESPHHVTRQNDFLQHGRVLRHLPQREEPLRHLGEVDPPRMEGRAARQGRHRLPGLPHAAGAPAAARAWDPSCPTCGSTCSTARTIPASSPASIEVRIHPEVREAEPGETVKLTAVVVNAKAGHKVPSGSAEERVLWAARDGARRQGADLPPAGRPEGLRGRGVHDRRRDALAYQDIGDIQGLAGFAGLKRDGEVPAGDRIFRLPYLDPKGRMTIAQWNTASFGPTTGWRRSPPSARPTPGGCRRTCRRVRSS